MCVCDIFSEKECIKKWKGLRDTYMKERKKEKERTRSGAGQTDHRPWRYFAVMGFLAPFVEQRDTTGNYCHGGGNRSPASQSAGTATPGPEEIESVIETAED